MNDKSFTDSYTIENVQKLVKQNLSGDINTVFVDYTKIPPNVKVVDEKNKKEDVLLGSFFTKEEVEKRRKKVEKEKSDKEFGELMERFKKIAFFNKNE